MGKTNFEKEEFEVLKQRLLLRRLDETPIWELHALVMQEAEMSALVAKRPRIPSWYFPACSRKECDRHLISFIRSGTPIGIPWTADRPSSSRSQLPQPSHPPPPTEPAPDVSSITQRVSRRRGVTILRYKPSFSSWPNTIGPFPHQIRPERSIVTICPEIDAACPELAGDSPSTR